jgi:hypothetical protein
MIENSIILIAANYLGQKETTQNSGFQDPAFQAKMEKIGWETGEAWCASFAKLVFLESYQNDLARLSELEHLFSKSAVQTYRNFDESNWKTRNKDGSPITVPQVGALVVWRKGRSQSGHIGVVVQVNTPTDYESIEGNTNDEGAREGYEVAVRRRIIRRTFDSDGLNLLGFILPKPVMLLDINQTVINNEK